MGVTLLPPSFVVPLCRYVSSFGAVGGFFIALCYGFSLRNHTEVLQRWLSTACLTKRFAFLDVWLGIPTDEQLLRNYAVLNLIQLNFVNLVLADQEPLSFVALSLTCLSAVPCLLLGFRHWNKMSDLNVPTFGFVQILWLSNKNTFKLLWTQWKRNETPAVKTSAFVGVFLCGLAFASPAYCASTELVTLDNRLSGGQITPVDHGQGSPIAQGNTGSNVRQSPYVRSQSSKMWDHLKDMPSNLFSKTVDLLALAGFKASYDAITGQQSPQTTPTGGEQDDKMTR